MSSTTAIVGIVLATTDDAVLFRRHDLLEEKWIPRSRCEDGDDISKGDEEIVVQDRWLRSEGWDE
jgi:hypothetical protein